MPRVARQLAAADPVLRRLFALDRRCEIGAASVFGAEKDCVLASPLHRIQPACPFISVRWVPEDVVASVLCGCLQLLTQELPRLAGGYTSASPSNKSFYLQSLTSVLAGAPSEAGDAASPCARASGAGGEVGQDRAPCSLISI